MKRLPWAWIILGGCYLGGYLWALDRIPLIAMDEAWYANTAYNWSRGAGLINTNAMWRGGDVFFVYTGLLALMYKLTSASLYFSRFLSVLLGFLGLVGIVLAATEAKLSRKGRLLTGWMWVISPLFYILLRRARPEVLVIALTAWALYFFLKFFKKQDLSSLILLSLCTALAGMTHPYAWAGIGAFGLAMAVQSFPIKSWRPLGVFAGVNGLLALAFLGALFTFKGMTPTDFFLSLTSSQRGLSSAGFFAGVWENTSRFVEGYTLNGKRLFFLMLELGILGLGLNSKKPALRGVSALALGYAGLSLVGFNPLFRWALGPTLAMACLIFADTALSDKKTVWSHLLKGLIVLYMLGQVGSIGWLCVQNWHNTPYSVIEKRISHVIPPGKKVMTQMELWFPLKETQVFTQSTLWKNTPYSGIKALQSSGQIDYIVLSSHASGETSPTFGKLSITGICYSDYFSIVSQWGKSSGPPLLSFDTRGYGTIHVWATQTRHNKPPRK